jgi:hypothetical protein
MSGKMIYCTIIDEGASTCIMSISCWRAIGSPKLSQSNTMLKAFNGHQFLPHGILTAFPIELGGKIVSVDMEVVDAPLEYNLLLGRSWFYVMMVVASSVFRVLCFPHQGCIVTINQLVFCTPNLRTTTGTNIPFVVDSQSAYTSIGAGMFKDSSLMGTFTLPPPSPTWIFLHPYDLFMLPVDPLGLLILGWFLILRTLNLTELVCHSPQLMIVDPKSVGIC